jgi:FtsZ-binding cell division protein ZapB
LLRYINELDTAIMNSEINTQSKQKDRRNNIIVIALSVILGIVVVLYFLQNREHRTIVNEINAEKDSIQFELTQIATSYDSLKTENDTINEQLFVAQAKVKDLLLEVEQTKKVSYSKISDYQKQVTTLRGIMRDFVVQIDSLNRRNEELMAENLEVKQQFKQVEQKNQQLNQEKQQLQNNLKRASMLKTRDLVAEPINSRSKVTKFARRAEKIRIYFVLGQNVATERGAKNIYARIMRPDQLLMSKSEDNLFQFEDLKIQYSAMREVVYEGKDLPVAIFWDNTGEPELMTGTYTVNLFADGFEIGETTFTLQ